jgi:hypothetical protein
LLWNVPKNEKTHRGVNLGGFELVAGFHMPTPVTMRLRSRRPSLPRGWLDLCGFALEWREYTIKLNGQLPFVGYRSWFTLGTQPLQTTPVVRNFRTTDSSSSSAVRKMFCKCSLTVPTSTFNSYSRKLENHMHAVSFYFMVYNFVKIHKSIKTTPAMQAGVTDFLWSMEDIVMMADTNA